ncbi:hypothetical protein MBAV_002821, partial [Candidatus Magnetobacterium bavaricum]
QPVHPFSFEPASAVAVRITVVPVLYDAVAVLPVHARVPSDTVTVPLPLPVLDTVRLTEPGAVCVTLKLLWPIVIAPVLELVPVLADTEYTTVPLPAPELPASIVSH